VSILTDLAWQDIASAATVVLILIGWCVAVDRVCRPEPERPVEDVHLPERLELDAADTTPDGGWVDPEAEPEDTTPWVDPEAPEAPGVPEDRGAAACVSGIARHEAGVARARAHNPKDFS
jgi:hypothetical protein